MEYTLILEDKATIEDILTLANLGFEFEINNGEITQVVKIGVE